MNAGTRILIEQLRKRSAEGMTRNEAADALGICYQTLVKHSLNHGIEWKRKPSGLLADRRNKEICDRYLAGERQVDLGTEYGISRERVRQIIEKAGLVSETKRHEDYVAVVAGTVSRKGLTLAGAADLFHTSKINVYLYCRKHGVSPSRITPEDIAELDALADEVIKGKSIRQAAGCDSAKERKVCQHLIKNGIQARGRSRHDNFTNRRNLIEKWRAAGHSWAKCANMLAENDGRPIGYQGLLMWCKRHMPHLFREEAA